MNKRGAIYLKRRQMYKTKQALDVVVGTGGIRKIRVASSGRGKRGGSRVIYSKNEKDDLSMAERKILKQIVEHWG